MDLDMSQPSDMDLDIALATLKPVSFSPATKVPRFLVLSLSAILRTLNPCTVLPKTSCSWL
jgi:hypothetical protein